MLVEASIIRMMWTPPEQEVTMCEEKCTVLDVGAVERLYGNVERWQYQRMDEYHQYYAHI